MPTRTRFCIAPSFPRSRSPKSSIAQQIQRLYEATQAVLTEWIERLRADAHGEFPEKVTAFREGMAVHGRYGQPCPEVWRQSPAHPLRVQRN